MKKYFRQEKLWNNILDQHMERRKFLHVICAAEYLWQRMYWIIILKIFIRKAQEISNVILVKKSSLHQNLLRDTSRHSIKDKKITNVILVENSSLSGNLKTHIKTHHEGQRNYKCNSCGKSFTRSGDLNKHMKTLHEGQKNYKCDSCGKFFSSSGYL